MTQAQRLALGIDTGGTYTDAVLLDVERRIVVGTAKALTTYRDLMIGVNEAIAALPPYDPESIELVSLSTTLATNAIVEGHGRPAALVLIGYDAEMLRQYGLLRELGTEDVHFVAGGHDTEGNEREPLDVAAVAEIARRRRDDVAAFAVSGYFSVRNPAHELRAKEIIERATGLPVTCGHELSYQLNSVRRATTAALNARLIPLLRDLIHAAQRTLQQRQIHAPLMLVKGDGSLLAAEVALERPVETILSGPAASAVGARYLSGLERLIAVDMGGTTTDIAVLADGQPGLKAEGARVGPWQTMVEAVNMRTAGLGGDSYVHLDRERGLQIGPQRVVPLAMFAAEYPQMLPILRRQAAAERLHYDAGHFIVAKSELPAGDLGVLSTLRDRPAAVEQLMLASGYPYEVRMRMEALERAGYIIRAAFTPTDALHVCGAFVQWSAEAARLGATILARRAESSPEEFCRRVVEGVEEKAAREIVAKLVSDAIGDVPWPGGPVADYLLKQALDHCGQDALLGLEMRVRLPVVAIGAPVAAYFPAVAERLHSELVIPPHAEVANAVGAVAGSIVQRVRLFILPLPEGGFRLHAPDGPATFAELADAVAAATAAAERLAQKAAARAGARDIRVRVDRRDQLGTAAAGWAERIYLGTEIIATAVGRAAGL